MGGTCSMYRGRREIHRGLWLGNEGNRPLGKPRQEGEVILNWINLAPVRDEWWDTVNVMMQGFFFV